MINSTSVTTEPPPPSSKNALVSYCLYSVEGGILIVTNGLILGTVLRHEVLRAKKQYIMIAALALADLWCAVGYFCAGIYRSRLILSGLDQTYVTAWYCMTTAHALVWSVGEQVSSNMLACISLDRLIAITFPLEYYGFGRGYSFGLAGLFYTYSVVLGIVAVISTYMAPRVAFKPAICFMGYSGAFGYQSVSTFYWTSWYRMSIASIVIFLFAIVIYRRKSLKVKPTTKQELKQDEKQQRRITITMGLSTLCTLVFFIGMYKLINALPDDLFYTLSPFTDNVKMFNPFCNIFLFTFRHKDIRKGMKYMFTCKKLTESALKTNLPTVTHRKDDHK